MNKSSSIIWMFLLFVVSGVTTYSLFANKNSDTEDYKFIVNVIKSCPEPKVEVDFEIYHKVKLTYNDVVVKINDYRRSGGNLEFDIYTLKNHRVYTHKELSEKTKSLLLRESLIYTEDSEVTNLKRKYLGETLKN